MFRALGLLVGVKGNAVFLESRIAFEEKAVVGKEARLVRRDRRHAGWNLGVVFLRDCESAPG